MFSLLVQDQTGSTRLKERPATLPDYTPGLQGKAGMMAPMKLVAPLHPTTSGEMPSESGSPLGFVTRAGLARKKQDTGYGP